MDISFAYREVGAYRGKIDAVQQRAPLSDALHDLEIRIAELVAKD